MKRVKEVKVEKFNILQNVFEGIIFLSFSPIIKYILNFNADREHLIFVITLAL